MQGFNPYLVELIELTEKAAASLASCQPQVTAALNGQPGQRLRNLVSLDDQRNQGAFFTGAKIANSICSYVNERSACDETFHDPACGVGDLLLAASHKLPVSDSLSETLNLWGNRISGRDISPEFVKAAKARLMLAALNRGARGGIKLPKLKNTFPNIRVGCGMGDDAAIHNASHILLNPPYGRIEAPEGCTWTAGLVSQAAVFYLACLRHAQPGTRLVAILPDVLRSGSTYSRWRREVEALSRYKGIKLLGQFDSWADVDVFKLDVVAAHQHDSSGWLWGKPALAEGGKIGDLFEIRVGPVVPFRLTGKGQWYPYAHAKNLTPWATMEDLPDRTRFTRTTFEPPFVLIRRTSRHGDKHRAVATILSGHGPVAIDNHLFVLKPKQGGLEACEQLMTRLGTTFVDDFLNKRIRCRHLTKSAISELPWRTMP